MIRINVTRQTLLDLINAHDSRWIAQAEARTKAYAKAQNYTGGTEFWGRIKQVYIRLQHEKCAYCETKLQGSVLASKVHEVEHFRPKSSLKAWPDRTRPHWAGFPPAIPTGAGHPQGYYLLAYHPFNYAIACTRCNSTLKSNHFPICGPRDVALADPSHGWGEVPLLAYPVSDLDDDPRDLIDFDGVLAVPRHATGLHHERALTTIWFFQLNHEDLTSRRAEMIVPLWNLLDYHRTLADHPVEQAALMADIRYFCSAQGQFSACMAAYCKLYEDHRPRAEAKFIEARNKMRGDVR